MDDWHTPMMQVAGGVHAGPLSGPGTLLAPRGITGYTMHRDSSGIRRSARLPGTKCVEESRLMSGRGRRVANGVDLDVDLRDRLAAPDRVFSHGWGNPTFEPRGGLIISSTTSAPACRITT